MMKNINGLDVNSNPNFRELCYSLLRQVPSGKVTTYKALAHAMGCRAYRAVGTAMNQNPDAPTTPCHRVVNASGELGGFAHGDEAKIAILQREGIHVSRKKNGKWKVDNFKEILFDEIDFVV